MNTPGIITRKHLEIGTILSNDIAMRIGIKFPYIIIYIYMYKNTYMDINSRFSELPMFA